MPDKVDKLYDDLKSQGYLEKDREHFRKFFFAPGNQGYTNRKALYDDLKGQGYLDSPTYEDFRDRLGLKAVRPAKTTTGNSSRTTPTNRTTPTRSQVGGTGRQTILDVESKKTILPSGFGDLDPEAGLPEYMREEAKKRREASYGTNPAAMQQRRRTEQTFKAVRGDQQAAKEVGLDRVNQQLRDRMDYTMATGEELKMPDDGIDYNAIGIAPTVARDEEDNVVTGEDGRPLVGMTTDEVRANTQRVEQERVYQEDLQPRLMRLMRSWLVCRKKHRR